MYKLKIIYIYNIYIYIFLVFLGHFATEMHKPSRNSAMQEPGYPPVGPSQLRCSGAAGRPAGAPTCRKVMEEYGAFHKWGYPKMVRL